MGEGLGDSWEDWEPGDPHPEICNCEVCEASRKEQKLWGRMRKARKDETFRQLYTERDAEVTMTMHEQMQEIERVRAQARDVARRAGALKDEVRMAEKHAGARKAEDGSWTCGVCGAESFDAEMFEQAGDDFGCLKLAVKKGIRPAGLEPVAAGAVVNARRWIEAAKAVSSSGTHDRAGRYDEELRAARRATGGVSSPLDRAIMNEIAKKQEAMKHEMEKLVAEKVGDSNGSLPVRALLPKVSGARDASW